jgi:hypothetical protein
MADHVAKELLTVMVISAFVITFLISAAVDVSEVDYTAIPETPAALEKQGYNQTVERAPTDLLGLAGLIPAELFIILVIPLATVIIYITAKSITGNLPFFGG